MLVIWNHGSGWTNLMPEDVVIKGISWDDSSYNHITHQQLGKTIQKISSKNYINIVGFDACLMQMVEVAYEIGSQSTDYILASEENEPGDGWDYDNMFKILKTANVSPEELVIRGVDSFIDFYESRK